MIDWALFGKLCVWFLPLLIIVALVLQLFTEKRNKNMKKRLYRLNDDKKIAGVCSGIADYFEIDPTIVRLAWLITVFCAGGGIIAYIIAMIVIPVKPEAM